MVKEINKKKINQKITAKNFRIQNSFRGLREHAIEYYLTRYVSKKGGICIKLPADVYPGIPDRLVISKKGIFFVELKTNRGYVSRIQRKTIATLNKLNCNTFVLRGIKEVKEWLVKHI